MFVGYFVSYTLTSKNIPYRVMSGGHTFNKPINTQPTKS